MSIYKNKRVAVFLTHPVLQIANPRGRPRVDIIFTLKNKINKINTTAVFVLFEFSKKVLS